MKKPLTLPGPGEGRELGHEAPRGVPRQVWNPLSLAARIRYKMTRSTVPRAL